jgi:hypothetical protein
MAEAASRREGKRRKENLGVVRKAERPKEGEENGRKAPISIAGKEYDMRGR